MQQDIITNVDRCWCKILDNLFKILIKIKFSQQIFEK